MKPTDGRPPAEKQWSSSASQTSEPPQKVFGKRTESLSVNKYLHQESRTPALHPHRTASHFPPGSIEEAINSEGYDAMNMVLRSTPYQQNHYQRNLLHLACRMDKPDKVNYLLSMNYDIHQVDAQGNTALHLAAGYCPSVVERLIALGARADTVNSQRENPLHHALQNNHASDDVCIKLWHAGASSRAKDRAGQTPIKLAEIHGRKDLVRYIEQNRGASSSLTSIRKKPDYRVHEACKAGNDARVIELINQGARLDCPDQEGMTPLHLAVIYLRSNTVKALLVQSANPRSTNKLGQSPLHLSVTCRSVDTFKLLLDQGGDPDQRDSSGHSAIMMAAQQGRFDILSLLLERHYELGLRPNIVQEALRALHENKYLSTPAFGHQMLHALAEIANSNHWPEELLLICRFIRPELSFYYALSAIEQSHWQLASRLLGELQSKKVRIIQPCRRTPVIPLLQSGQSVLLEQIMQISPGIINEPGEGGMTPLHIACSDQGSQKVLSQVLTEKPFVNAVDNEGSTALHTALANRSLDSCKLLLDAGADPSLCDKAGYSVFMSALLLGRMGVVAEIEQRNPELTPSPEQLVQTLKHLKFPLCQRDSSNLTLLHRLIKSRRWKLVEAALAIDPFSQGTSPWPDGAMPAEVLLKEGKVALLETLIQKCTTQPVQKTKESTRKTVCEGLLPLDDARATKLLKKIGRNNDREALRLYLNDLMPASLRKRPADARYPHITLILLNDEEDRLSKSIGYLLKNPWCDVVFMDKTEAGDQLDIDWDPVKLNPDYPVVEGSKWVFYGHGPNLMGLDGEYFATSLNTYMDARQCPKQSEIDMTVYGCYSGPDLMDTRGNNFMVKFAQTLGHHQRCPQITAASKKVYVCKDTETLCAETEKQPDGTRQVKIWQGRDQWLDPKYARKQGFTGITEDNRRFDLIKEYQYLPGTGVSCHDKYRRGEEEGGLDSL